jgi:hypothetical protein
LASLSAAEVQVKALTVKLESLQDSHEHSLKDLLQVGWGWVDYWLGPMVNMCSAVAREQMVPDVKAQRRILTH